MRTILVLPELFYIKVLIVVYITYIESNMESIYTSVIFQLLLLSPLPYFVFLILQELFSENPPRIAKTMLSLRTSMDPEHTK